MKKTVGIILASALLSLHGCSSNSVKQETIQPAGALNKTSGMVASVNGQPITESAIKNLQIETAMYNRRLKVPREKMIEELVDRELLYQEAIEQGFDKNPAVAEQIKVASRAIVSKAYMRSLVDKTSVSREEVKAEYKRRSESANLKQFRTSQIRVDSEEQATQIIVQLKQGKVFQELAKQYSKDSSASKGSGSSWRKARQMEPQIATAVELLKAGEYSIKPVKTSSGWNIILLEEVREQEMRSFDKQEHSLTSILKRKKLKKYIEQLEAKSSIEFFEPEPKQAQSPAKKAMSTKHAGH